MRIAALQRMTLLDYPGHLACTVFLPGCNLRCPFCHNASLVLPGSDLPDEMSRSELMDFLGRRKGKLDGVCITGGEPTLHPDLPELMDSIRQMGFLVKLDTNGSSPAVLKTVLEDGLADYVAMDIKNCPERYLQTCGGADVLDSVRESAAMLMEGKTDYEFRTTVFRPAHDPEAMQSIGRWLEGAKRYFLQNFVDSGNLVGTGCSALKESEIHALREAVLPWIPETQIRGI